MTEPAAPPAWTPPPGWVPTPQGWVPPAALPRAQRPPATEGPLPFHRLYRGLAGYRWWRPVVAIVVAAAVYLALSLVYTLILIGVAVATGQLDLGSTVESAQDALYDFALNIDAANPVSLLLALGSIALMLPSALLGQLAAGLRPLGVRHSVTFRIRWSWFAVSLLPAFVTVAAGTVIPVVGSLATGEAPFGAFTTEPALFVVCAVIILVVTPFQAAAEEYVFRGLFAQSLGAWVRFAPIGWIVTTALFVSGHAYDGWGLLSVGAFGLGAAIIATRTGGLEAGVALHSVNNITGFLLLASGVQGTTVNPNVSSPDVLANLLSVGLALLTTAAWVFWVDRLAKRRKLEVVGVAPARNSVDPVVPAAPSA